MGAAPQRIERPWAEGDGEKGSWTLSALPGEAGLEGRSGAGNGGIDVVVKRTGLTSLERAY